MDMNDFALTRHLSRFLPEGVSKTLVAIAALVLLIVATVYSVIEFLIGMIMILVITYWLIP